jgi:hypothetical protein
VFEQPPWPELQGHLVEPDPPAASSTPVDAVPPLIPPAMPRVWATIGRGLDLCLSANRELRRASLYIGLLTLGLVAPFVVIVLAYGALQGGFGWLGDVMLGFRPDLIPVDDAVAGLLGLSGVLAALGYLVISIESQIMAAGILAGRAVFRPLTLREAVRRSRQCFWRVVGASVVVGMLLIGPTLILNVPLEAAFGANSEAASLVATVVGALLSAPFAYLVAGIVLGDVGVGESIRRSVRLARARWRLAVAVASVSAVVAYIQLFAIGAGVDILARVATFLHLGFDSGGGTFALAIVVLLGVLSLGSLTFTLSALIVAPQVVAFLGLTGYSAGIERSRDGSGSQPVRVRWISVPMAIAIVIGVWAGVTGVAAMS